MIHYKPHVETQFEWLLTKGPGQAGVARSRSSSTIRQPVESISFKIIGHQVTHSLSRKKVLDSPNALKW